MSTSPNPMSGFIQKYSSLPGRALNAIEHPVDTLESLLGFAPQQPPEDPNKDPYIIEGQREALNSFRDAQQQPTPLHAMNKPLGNNAIR